MRAAIFVAASGIILRFWICSYRGGTLRFGLPRTFCRLSASDRLQAREVGAGARHRLRRFANASLEAIAGDYPRKARILGIADEN